MLVKTAGYVLIVGPVAAKETAAIEWAGTADPRPTRPNRSRRSQHTMARAES